MDPLSICGLSFAVIQILRPVITDLTEAVVNGGGVNQALEELSGDLSTVCDLVENIHQLFRTPDFIDTIRGSLDGSVKLIEVLGRELDNCSRDAQKMRDILVDLDLTLTNNRVKQTFKLYRLNNRMEDINAIKRNIQDHKSSIQLAFQMITTYVPTLYRLTKSAEIDEG